MTENYQVNKKISELNQLYNDFNSSQSAYTFENFVISTLKKYLKAQGKEARFTTNELQKKDVKFDLFLPYGIDDIDEPIYVEIKYYRFLKQSYINLVKEMISKYFNSDIKNVILIFSVELPDSFKKQITEYSFVHGIDIIIWDIKDFFSKANIHISDEDKNFEKFLFENSLSYDVENDSNIKLKNNANMSRLRVKYQQEDVVLFLGAGVSIASGIPSWERLIKSMFFEMLNQRIGEDNNITNLALDTLSNLVFTDSENSPITQMRFIKQGLAFADQTKTDLYHRTLYNILYKDIEKNSSAMLESICQICTPRRNHIGIKAIVTYNFDDLLENCLETKNIDYNVVYKESDISLNDKLNLYHVHGFLPSRSEQYDHLEYNLVFSEEDYHKVYRDSFSWSNLAQLNFFRENTCLFIGCSLKDPNTRRLLDYAARNGEEPRHYAFLQRKRLERLKVKSSIEKIQIKNYYSLYTRILESYYASLGLNIVWFSEFNEIPGLVKSIIALDKSLD